MDFKRIKHFKQNEFASPDEKSSGSRMKEKFLIKLDFARELSKTPFVITSGFRTEEHNKKVGGVRGSAHTRGLAADIECKTPDERYKILNALILVGFKRIGIDSNFIHADLDESKPQEVIWLYG